MREIGTLEIPKDMKIPNAKISMGDDGNIIPKHLFICSTGLLKSQFGALSL